MRRGEGGKGKKKQRKEERKTPILGFSPDKKYEGNVFYSARI